MTHATATDLEIIGLVFPDSAPVTDAELTIDERSIAQRIRTLAASGAAPCKTCGQIESGQLEAASVATSPIPFSDFQKAKAALMHALPNSVVLSYYEIDELVAAALGCISPARAFVERCGTPDCGPLETLERITARTGRTRTI